MNPNKRVYFFLNCNELTYHITISWWYDGQPMWKLFADLFWSCSAVCFNVSVQNTYRVKWRNVQLVFFLSSSRLTENKNRPTRFVTERLFLKINTYSKNISAETEWFFSLVKEVCSLQFWQGFIHSSTKKQQNWHASGLKPKVLK